MGPFPSVYEHLYNLPVRRRVCREWVLELRRQEFAMRQMLAFVLDPVTDSFFSYLDAGPDSNFCFWILRQTRLGFGVSRRAAAMLDLRWDARFTIGVLLRMHFWYVHLGRPQDRCGHTHTQLEPYS